MDGEDARAVLRTLQDLVDARDLDGLLELFDEGSVLIGTAGDGRDRAGVSGCGSRPSKTVPCSACSDWPSPSPRVQGPVRWRCRMSTATAASTW